MKHFLDFTTTASIRERLGTYDEKTLVVYSPTTLKNLSDIRHSTCAFISTHDIGKDATRIKEMCSTLKINRVVALGGGTAVDIAKYIAFLTQNVFICMPTMLSTNAFSTNKVALMQDDVKVTLDAKLPDEIILDLSAILEAEPYNLYGLCDIFSIHTALRDWEFADKANVEKINIEVYRKSQRLLDSALQLAPKIVEPTINEISVLFELIGESGHITNLYGSGRPESGSEHIFAKELERRVPVPHGISIAAGITLMSYLQDNHSGEVQSALEQTGVMDALINDYDLQSHIELSLSALSPRSDRYTILNERLPDSEEYSRLIHVLYGATRTVA